jgi:hypothetical protein
MAVLKRGQRLDWLDGLSADEELLRPLSAGSFRVREARPAKAQQGAFALQVPSAASGPMPTRASRHRLTAPTNDRYQGRRQGLRVDRFPPPAASLEPARRRRSDHAPELMTQAPHSGDANSAHLCPCRIWQTVMIRSPASRLPRNWWPRRLFCNARCPPSSRQLCDRARLKRLRLGPDGGAERRLPPP